MMLTAEQRFRQGRQKARMIGQRQIRQMMAGERGYAECWGDLERQFIIDEINRAWHERTQGEYMAEVFDTIPHDGSDQIFEVTMRLHAFWCPDLRDWILCRPMKAERLPSGARHIGPFGSD